MAGEDGLGPVELLRDQGADHQVGPGHGAQRQHQIGPRLDRFREPLGAADRDRQVPDALIPPALDLARQGGAGQPAPGFVQRDLAWAG